MRFRAKYPVQGILYFGPGTYSSFSIHLRSDVGLYLDHGATLLAASPTDRPENVGYDAAEPAPNRFEDYGHRQRGETKTHAPVYSGRVTRLVEVAS